VKCAARRQPMCPTPFHRTWVARRAYFSFVDDGHSAAAGTSLFIQRSAVFASAVDCLHW
jgi:hypothetical protein